MPGLGPILKNKSTWYLLTGWVLSISLLSLPKQYKAQASDLAWRLLYSPFYQTGEMIRGLYNVHQTNEMLTRRIAGLIVTNSLLEEQGLENQRLRELLQLRTTFRFDVVPGEVLSRDPQYRLNSLVIGVGAAQGILENMPVIDTRGLAGKVLETLPDRSVVQLLFDPGFKASAVVQRSRVLGIICWKSGQLLELKYVPLSEDVQIGDLVITSGLGATYPPGLEIGRVVAVSQDKNLLFKTIDVSPSANIQNLEELFVVKLEQAGK